MELSSRALATWAIGLLLLRALVVLGVDLGSRAEGRAARPAPAVAASAAPVAP